MGFLLGVISSLVASVILILSTNFSVKWKRLLIRFINHFVDGDIDYIYKDKAAAEKDIQQEIMKAKDVYVYTGRGNELQRKTFSSLFFDRNENRKCNVRILLPDTGNLNGGYDWTNAREMELVEVDVSFGNGLLRSQIDTNVKFLEPYVTTGKVSLKRYNAPHIGRIIYVDGAVYFTPYASDSHGRDSAVYKFKRNGSMSNYYLRYFEQIWKSIEPEPQPLSESKASEWKDAAKVGNWVRIDLSANNWLPNVQGNEHNHVIFEHINNKAYFNIAANEYICVYSKSQGVHMLGRVDFHELLSTDQILNHPTHKNIGFTKEELEEFNLIKKYQGDILCTGFTIVERCSPPLPRYEYSKKHSIPEPQNNYAISPFNKRTNP